MKKIWIFIILIFSLVLVGCTNNKYDKPVIPENDDNGETEQTPDINKDDDEVITNTKLLSLDIVNNKIELLGVKQTKLSKDIKVSRLNNNKLTKEDLNSLYLGMENIYVKAKGEEVLEIIIDGEPVINNIRVAIRNSINNISDEATLFHDVITIQSLGNTYIKTFDNEKTYKVKRDDYLSFQIINDNIICYNDNVLIKSSKRLIIKGVKPGIRVISITRSIGVPMYEGNLEISIVNGKLLLTNDINLEDYLKKVVPSEMPASWNIEALKAQAVAARTYAYREFFNKIDMSRGYMIDDSTSSQVYNNGFEDDSTNKAVLDTKGEVLFNNNKPIVSYYYSAGCGLKAAGNEVWISDTVKEDIPYLHGGNVSNKSVDTSNEKSMLSFFKDLNIDAPSVLSSRFRWHIPLTKEQIRHTLNYNLPLMAKGNKSCYKIIENNEVVNKDFPEDIGEIIDVRVEERGQSGVVICLEVEAKNVTFRIYNQYNIRFTLRPKDCGSDVKGFSSPGLRYTYLNVFNNPSILPSGFFSLEWDNDILNIYGGGNGHGVGMDQYGANSLASDGKSYKDILTTYYTNVEFKDIVKTYKIRENYLELFK